ncbi:MAG: hypothetical protein KF744_17210 [Taibaiella sp.]|nr:hypothetical protein [Taibaiella sp.]
MELSVKRNAYSGTLKTDGYYFEAADDTSKYSEIFFLYRNGILQGGYSELVEKAETGTITIDNVQRKQIKYYWGAFNIDASELQIESWLPLYAGCLRTKLRKGRVLDDTTFLITKVVLFERKGKVSSEFDVSDTFHFHATLQKPDSTNDFIK